jgi:hypothetical protein
MTGYTKLFNSILGSTVWREPAATKVVWITMLALADRYGEVEASIPGLAHLSGQSIEETEAALKTFLAPDPYSRTPEHEGRRIEAIDGGWCILNHGKYRERMSEEDTKERNKIRQARFRERHKVTPERYESVTGVTRDASNDIQRPEGQRPKAREKKEKNNPPAASAAVRGLCENLSLSGKRQLSGMQEVVTLEAKKTGQSEEDVVSRLLNLWRFYKAEGRPCGWGGYENALAYFQGGAWRDNESFMLHMYGKKYGSHAAADAVNQRGAQ